MGNSRLKDTGFLEFFFYCLGRRRRYRIDGQSMLPTLKPGDDVLARPLPKNLNMVKKIQLNDILVFFDRERGRIMIKRVSKLSGTHILVAGDNKTQSAEIAPVQSKDALALVTSRLKS